MAQDNDKGQDKTEEPTPKRREDYRKKGQVAQSRDLASVAVLLSVTSILVVWAPSLLSICSELCYDLMVAGVNNPASYVNDPTALLISMLYLIGKLVGPILAAAFVAALFASIGQVGLVVSWQPLQPDLNKLNPIKGIQQKMFSAQAVAEWLKAMLKVTIVGFVSWRMWEAYSPGLNELASRDLQGSLTWTMILVAKLVGYTLLLMVVLAVGDYIFSRWQLYQQMRMTLQELRDETKESDGDPYRNARVRQLMRELSSNRLVAEVNEATVVITNPSHYAVALRYEMGQAGPPIVVARGTDMRAARIKDIARSSGIPRVENRPLARALYSHTRVGQEIPGDLYEAVAEVLAFVYRIRAAQRPPEPALAVP
ncbi:MAG TPA: flagellar biosynthesis protein FlhB [Deltaproteobacteria bacterium]|nr:flagellar biosynthesis protein FlhB [Deltaproteobacteria bacterium]HCP45072.1 flagellar biosynthesis protein FlhB [Deltaproteobacteria bacterium]|tara:strand:- start:919 stop:2025 length:1107 start_codon:yes stop_codon:yes gene_type:complete